jgi:hypothetical protein
MGDVASVSRSVEESNCMSLPLLQFNAERGSADASRPTTVRCRPITTADIGAVVDLLRRGFGSQRSRGFWIRMLEQLKKYPTPTGVPKYGYLLEHAGRPVGVLLLISSVVQSPSARSIRCNGSSWYVEPEFRPYGSLLVTHALRQKAVTYLNISPAPHTWRYWRRRGTGAMRTGYSCRCPGSAPLRLASLR